MVKQPKPKPESDTEEGRENILGLRQIREKAQNRIDRLERVTIVGNPSRDLIVGATSYDELAPRFKVIKLEIDGGNTEILISGSEALIPLQLSLVSALDELIKIRCDWTKKQFQNWAKNFEDGFLDFTGQGDFNRWRTQGQPWGVDKANRPRILELENSKAENKEYEPKAVQLFPDRKILSDFYIFSGTYRDIASQIITFWNQKTGDSKTKVKGEIYPLLKGRPLIKLHFYSNDNNKRAEAEISIRIMDKIDDPEPGSNLTKISEADLRVYAERIVNNFAKPTPYIWQKGKDCVSYRDRTVGLEGVYYCRSLADGVALIQRLLNIAGRTPKPEKIFHSQSTAPEVAFPDEPGSITLFGKQVDRPKRRPIVDVKFVRAEISLASLPDAIQLVDRGGRILV